ncbi:MAG: flagellar biosynthesis protein FlhF [Treponemataceae bacterium]
MDRLSSTIEKLYETAEDERSCLEKIRNKYGNNFYVISKQKLRREHLFGLIKTDAFEIEYYPTLPKRTVPITPVSSFEDEKKKILSANPPKQIPQLQELIKEMSELKELVITNTTNTAQTNIEHETLIKITDLLEKNEFSSSYIRKILDRIKKDFSLDELENFDIVQDKVVEWIGQSINIYRHKHIAKTQIITLVGATGVGKTLTLAKLAANFAFQTKINPQLLKVHVISIDGYRIGAFEQLEKLCGWMKVSFSRVENHEDLKKTLAFYDNDVDIILIDTSGASPSDYETISRMRKMLDMKSTSAEFFLVISAATKASTMREIIQQFETFDYQSVIVTKLDETKTVGDLISILDEKNKSMMFFSTGQKVPHDFEHASVLTLLTSLVDFKIDRSRIEDLFSST